jgi:hypothetical protein
MYAKPWVVWDQSDNFIDNFKALVMRCTAETPEGAAKEYVDRFGTSMPIDEDTVDFFVYVLPEEEAQKLMDLGEEEVEKEIEERAQEHAKTFRVLRSYLFDVEEVEEVEKNEED